MAVWQFDLQLMPDQIVPDAPDCIDAAITKDGLDSSSWWLNNQHNDDYRQIIASVFAPLDSWSPDILRWGDEKLVLVEAFTEESKIEGIGIRIDVRHIDRESIAKIIQMTARLDCHLFVMGTQQIVTSNVNSLLTHLAKSKAVEFARDPKGFIDRLARENAN